MVEKLSIIIAAYNAEKTLARAIDSVVNQYVEGVELLIVENGSTDATQQIIDAYADRFKWIIPAKSSKGASCARNEGLHLASGEYVTFLDADDVLTAEAIATVKNDLRYRADLYVYGIQMPGEKTIRSQERLVFEGDTLTEGKYKMIANPTAYMQVCASFYRLDRIREHHLMFDTTLFLSEDSDFTLRYLEHVQRLVMSDTTIYFCPSDNQQSLTRIANPEKTEQMLTALNKSSAHFSMSTHADELKLAFSQYVLMNVNVIMVRQIYNVAFSQKWGQRNKQFKKVFSENLVQSSMRTLTLSDTLKSVRLWPFAFYKLKLPVLSQIMFVVRSYQNNTFEKRNQKEKG